MGAERDRHPSAGRWRPDLDRLRTRLVQELRSEGDPMPETAADALLRRGLTPPPA